MFVSGHSVWQGLLHSESYSTQQPSAEAGLQGLLALAGPSLHCSLLRQTCHLASLIFVTCLSPIEIYLVTLAKA